MTGLFFHNIARRWPVNPVYDPNGYYMEGNEVIQMEDGGIQNNQKDYTYQQLQLVIEPIKDWRIIAEGNVNSITNFQHWEVLPVYAHAANGDPFAFSWDGRAVGSTTVSEYGYKENFLTTNIYSDILESTMDTYSSIINNNMNTVMRTLTSVSIILMFPTLIASLFGMNLQNGMETSKWGFIIAMIISVFISGLSWWIFRHKRLI